MVIFLLLPHWFSKLESFNERQQHRGESDKAKKGKLLYSLMQALLPVWESLVMLGPGQGGKVEGGREERDERKEGDRRIDKDAAATGNVNLRLFFLGRTRG